MLGKIMDKKTNHIPLIIFIFFLVFSTIIGCLTSYKQETLLCSKTKNICKIQKTNLFNIRSEKILTTYSDIKTVSYKKQKIKGNRYAQGYIEYFLTFTLNNNDKIKVFSKSFYEISELKKFIKEIHSQMKDKNLDEIKIDRD